jgi:dolichol-phosphate mannosyltransferase
MTALIIIPTYNENKNITKLLSKIKKLNTEVKLNILIIDDSSPDGTAKTIKSIMSTNKNIYLIERESKMGLGSAYCVGFKWAIKKEYDYVIQMDADLSHNPNDIISLLSNMNHYDIAIGSRYKTGVNVVNWPLRRLMLSYFANVYARIFTGVKIHDLTGGFKCISIKALKSINLSKIRSEGYSFQIELNFLFWNKNFRIIEVPIIFYDRTIGESKMSKKIIFEAIIRVPLLRLKKIFNIK